MRRLILIISLLVSATALAATTQKLSDLPTITTLRDAARFYIFDSMSGNRNITGAALKNAIAVSAGALSEAPVDGNTYGRKDAGWIAVTTGGGGVSQSAFDTFSTATQDKLNLKLAASTFASYTSVDRVTTSDSRLSDARTPTSHNNSAHSETYITASALTPYKTVATFDSYSTSTQSKLNLKANTAALGTAAYTASSAYEASGAVSTHAALTTGVHGAGANSLIYSNDSRLSDSRTPTTHNNTAHSETYITAAALPTTYKVATSDFTTSSTSAANVTGLTWSISASQEMSFDCFLNTTNTATSLLRFGVSGPASPTAVAVSYSYRSTAYGTEVINAAGAFTATATTAAVTASVLTTPILFHIRGIIKNGSNAGTVAVHATASTSGQTGTIRTGSRCIVY